jgi:hypothetical protein
MNTKTKALVGTLAGAIALAVIFQAPLRWTAKKIHRSVYPGQIPERPVYDETAKAPVDLAAFVTEAREAWPAADAAVVHTAAVDVATGLLMRTDIEVGSVVDGKFEPWGMSPWAAAKKIQAQIKGMPGFLSDHGLYVFRRRAT